MRFGQVPRIFDGFSTEPRWWLLRTLSGLFRSTAFTFFSYLLACAQVIELR